MCLQTRVCLVSGLKYVNMRSTQVLSIMCIWCVFHGPWEANQEPWLCKLRYILSSDCPGPKTVSDQFASATVSETWNSCSTENWLSYILFCISDEMRSLKSFLFLWVNQFNGQVGLMGIETIFIVEFVCVLEDKEPQFDSICSILKSTTPLWNF